MTTTNKKPMPAPAMKATLRAKMHTGSSIEVSTEDIDGRVIQMIAWMLHNQTPALMLFDEYTKVREWWSAEGSSKNHGVEP